MPEEEGTGTNGKGPGILCRGQGKTALTTTVKKSARFKQIILVENN